MRYFALYARTQPTLSHSRRKGQTLVIWMLVAWLALSPAWPSVASAQENTSTQTDIPTQTHSVSAPFRPGRLLVGIAPDASLEAVTASLRAQGVTIRRVYADFRLVEVALVGVDVAGVEAEVDAAAAHAVAATQAAQAALSALPGVHYVDLDYLVQVAQEQPGVTGSAVSPATADPLIDQQWGLTKIRARDAWQIAHGNAQFAVAVLDSGYDSHHPDLPEERVWVNQAEMNGQSHVDDDDNGYTDDLYGWDWIDGDNEPNDLHGHGTHVFGIISAAVNNGIGIAGLGPNLQVAPLRVLDANGNGFVTYLIAALDYARIMGFRIANLSLTVPADLASLRNAVMATDNAGMVVVAAAGNTGGSVLWPAAYPQVVAVAATTETDTRADFSNTGPQLDLAAPGNNILSTYPVSRVEDPADAYKSLKGTSMAAPHVAAAVALAWSLRPDLTSDQVVDLLKTTAVDVNQATQPGPDSDIGAGRLDLAAALYTASEGLTLVGNDQTALIVLPNSPIDFPVEVTAPGGSNGLAVNGAVLRYRLYDVEGTALRNENQVTTDANGIGGITLTAPVQEGAYYIRVDVGAAALELPFAVHDTPINMTIGFSQIETEVAGQPVEFTIELRDTDGELITLPLPVYLETNLGSFVQDGVVQGQPRTVTNGVYTGRLYPGTQAGIVLLKATVGTASAQAALTIVPGPAAKVLGPADGIPVITLAANQLALTFMIQDAYGNPVVDETEVQFQSASGTLNPAMAKTRAGQVETELTLFAGVKGPVHVRVTVPGTDVDVTHEVPTTRHFYLPIVRLSTF